MQTAGTKGSTSQQPNVLARGGKQVWPGAPVSLGGSWDFVRKDRSTLIGLQGVRSAYIYIYMYVYIYIYIICTLYQYVCIHIYIYIYIHTHVITFAYDPSYKTLYKYRLLSRFMY